MQDLEMEDLSFYYANYSLIYNDVITLYKGSFRPYVRDLAMLMCLRHPWSFWSRYCNFKAPHCYNCSILLVMWMFTLWLASGPCGATYYISHNCWMPFFRFHIRKSVITLSFWICLSCVFLYFYFYFQYFSLMSFKSKQTGLFKDKKDNKKVQKSTDIISDTADKFNFCHTSWSVAINLWWWMM